MQEDQPPRKDRRGGARPGAGRPRKNPPVIPAPPPPAAAVTPIGADALATLEAIMRDPLSPATARVAAAKALLAHKAGQPVETDAAAPGEIMWLKRDGSGHA